MRVADFCPQYLAMMRDTLSPVTYSNYERTINGYIIPTIGHFKLKDVRPLHIQRFIGELGREDARLDGKGVLSPASIHRYLVVVQSIFAKAYRLELISGNPADGDKLDVPKIEEPEVNVFTKEQAANMLACLEEEPIKYQVLVQLAILTGCRRGKLIALKWDCVDLDTKSILVKLSNYKLKGEEIKSKAPKTKKSIRKVSIPDYAVNLLRRHKITQMEERLALGSQWQEENWIFTQWNGAPMYPTTLTQWFTKFLKRHGLEHRKFHSLRHTSATLLLVNGVDIKTVANRLGHTQLSTTNRYLHALEEADKTAAQSLGRMLEAKPESSNASPKPLLRAITPKPLSRRTK